jgi:hypothetical protein
MIGSADLPPARRLRALVLGAALAAAACGGDSSKPAAKGAIDRETFIATYVELRAVTIRSDSFAISDAQRADVLARHGVTEAQLLGFAELHGQDVPFMRSVWDEVEARLDAQRVLPADGGAGAGEPAPDTAADPAPPRRPELR